jgi:hypothetical protein
MRPAAVLMIILMTLTGTVWAQSEVSGVPWSQLGQDEQQLLQRFSGNWDQLPPERQQRLLNGARQWQNMNPQERDEARQRFQQWQQLPPDQQQRLRERFQRFRQLPPEQREAIRNARQWFRSLPPERRQEMRDQWRNMSQAERREFRRQLRKEYGGGSDRPLHNEGPRHPRPARPTQ